VRIRWGSRATFASVLDEVERRPGLIGGPPERAFATYVAPIDRDPGPGLGASEHWDRALEWIAEPPESTGPAKTLEAPSDSPDTIARELGLSRALTLPQLRHARRRFMWNNHPDRRPEVARELANRRVAIANMLIDGAARALAKSSLAEPSLAKSSDAS
jgi:hypothetical protein